MRTLYAVLFALSLVVLVSHGYNNPCQDGEIPFQEYPQKYNCVARDVAFAESMRYLERNLPSFDEMNKCSLGFKDDFDNDEAVDGLEDGIANYGTNLSLTVKAMYHWAADVPKETFMEYVLPFANVNEGRNNWRPLMLDAVQQILASSGKDIDQMTVTDVVMAVNSGIWSAFGKTIVFKSSQTPLIYDPMSIIAFGYASCTGVSIFFVDALRSIGIPSRISGTPAWNTVPSNGNHNWIEVLVPASDSDRASQHVVLGGNKRGWTWKFIEAAPAGSNETLDNPCDKWFCTPSNFANGTQVYSARYDQDSNVRYPMAWDPPNKEIPGEDRSQYYQSVCNAC